MLSGHHLSYTIKGKHLLRNVSVTCNPGVVHFIMGPNGAGKSTLLKILAGTLNNYEGAVEYNHKSIHQFSVSALAKTRAVLSQNLHLSFPLTVKEVVLMGRYPYYENAPAKVDVQCTEEAMEYFGLSNFADRNIDSLSGGEKQRVHFARVAAQLWHTEERDARYLLLDEPFTYLDIFYQHSCMEKLIRFSAEKKIGILGVVHDLNFAGKFANEITLLHNGNLIAHGHKDAVLTAEHIKEAYHIDVRTKKEHNTIHVFY